MALRFNPPPNWPAPPPGWQPPAGWSPDPAWGPAPEGWNLWVDDAAAGAVPPPPVAPSAPQAADVPPAPSAPTAPPAPVSAPAPAAPTAPLPPIPGAPGAAPAPGAGPVPDSVPGAPSAPGAPSYAPANYGPAPTVGSGVNYNQAAGQLGEAEGDTKKSSKTPIIVISVISVLLIGIIVAIIALLMGGDDSTPTESASPTETASEEPSEDPTEEPTEEPTEDPTEEPTEDPTEEPTQAPAGATGSVDSPLPLGTKIVLVDSDGNEMWEVTPVSAKLDATEDIDEFNADGFITNDDAPEGQQWASITLDVVYLGADSETPSAWDIEISFISAGKVYNVETLVWGNEDSLQDIGEVYAGAGGTGTEYFKIPSENAADGVWRINYAWNWSEDVNYFFEAE